MTGEEVELVSQGSPSAGAQPAQAPPPPAAAQPQAGQQAEEEEPPPPEPFGQSPVSLLLRTISPDVSMTVKHCALVVALLCMPDQSVVSLIWLCCHNAVLLHAPSAVMSKLCLHHLLVLYQL